MLNICCNMFMINLSQQMVPASTPSVDSTPAFSSASVEGSSNLGSHQTQNFTPSDVMLVAI
jgi:hypothetical protein